MLTVHVGIRHDDNLVVAELLEVCLLAVLADAEAYAESLDDIVHFVALESLVPHCLLDVQDFTSERQDGLRAARTCTLCRAACGVSLHEEQFAFCGVFA